MRLSCWTGSTSWSASWRESGHEARALRHQGVPGIGQDAADAAQSAKDAQEAARQAAEAAKDAADAQKAAADAQKAADQAMKDTQQAVLDKKPPGDVDQLSKNAQEAQNQANAAKQDAETAKTKADAAKKSAGDKAAESQKAATNAKAKAAQEKDDPAEANRLAGEAATSALNAANAAKAAGVSADSIPGELKKIDAALAAIANSVTSAEREALASALQAKLPPGVYVMTEENLTHRIHQSVETIVGKHVVEKVFGDKATEIKGELQAMIKGNVKHEMSKDFEEWIGGKWMTTVKDGKQEHNKGWSHKTVVGMSSEIVLGKKLSVISPFKSERILGGENKFIGGWKIEHVRGHVFKKAPKEKTMITNCLWVIPGTLVQKAAGTYMSWKNNRVVEKAQERRSEANKEIHKLDKMMSIMAGVAEFQVEEKIWTRAKQIRSEAESEILKAKEVHTRAAKLKMCENLFVVKK